MSIGLQITELHKRRLRVTQDKEDGILAEDICLHHLASLVSLSKGILDGAFKLLVLWLEAFNYVASY